MQPVRIGLNAAVVLLVLLLSVPLQLLLSHLISLSAPVAKGRPGDISEARTEAMEQLVSTAESFFDSLHSTIMYYSTWNHLKELVLVPYRKTPRTNMKSTVVKTKAGTTTILISSMDDTKAKKKTTSSSVTSSSSASSSNTRSTSGQSGDGQTGSQTGKTSSGVLKEPVVKKQFHKAGSSYSQKESSSASTAKKPAVIEEVSHAKEVEEYLMSEVYFAQSKTARERKPARVAFSVGQVVKHKMAKYIGVVIGWDEVAKAPEKWIKQYYSDRKGVELTTHYLVLVDSKFSASGTPYHYVPQEDLEIGPQQQLRCPEITDYFEGFKNGRHIPKPWLQDRYPKD